MVAAGLDVRMHNNRSGNGVERLEKATKQSMG